MNTKSLDSVQIGSAQYQREEAGHTWTSSGFPKRKALSRFFLKASSKKLVLVILRSLYSFIMNSVAWPDGSMISGYLEREMVWNRSIWEVTQSQLMLSNVWYFHNSNKT